MSDKEKYLESQSLAAYIKRIQKEGKVLPPLKGYYTKGGKVRTGVNTPYND